MEINKTKEELLVRRCLKGERSAHRELYEAHKSKQFAICLRYLRNREEAEDLLQEGFIKVYNNLHTYKGEGSLAAWISRVMVNTVLMHLRKANRLKFVDRDEEVLQSLSVSRENILDDLNARVILDLIRSLPTGYQTIFNMYAVEGYQHKEIAERLNISESTSRTQYMRAKAAIRKLLEKTIDA